MTPDPTRWSLTEAAEAVRAGRVTSEALTRACLDRIEALEPRVNAFVHVEAEFVLEAARRADRALAEGGEPGPLHGVPVARKDMFDRAGQVASCGARLLRERVNRRTAGALARLDRAGAVDLGGLNMSEFAFHLYGANTLDGPPRNPWDLERVAGGSSGGPAAALASGMAFGALGSDSGGSIRSPAALCGVVGLVPTRGRVGRAGMMLSSPSLDVAGPMARTVADTARLFAALAGRDEGDPATVDWRAPDTDAALMRPPETLPVALPKDADLAGLPAPARSALAAARDALDRLGVPLVEVALPDLDGLNAVTALVFLSEVAGIHRQRLRNHADAMHPEVRERMLPGFAISQADYRAALDGRAKACAAFCEATYARARSLLLPSAPGVAPRFAEVFGDRGGPPPRSVRSLATAEDPGRYTRFVNYLGLPALALPVALSEEGLPLGVQLVGRPFDEAALFTLGHHMEKELGMHDRHPPLFDDGEGQ